MIAFDIGTYIGKSITNNDYEFKIYPFLTLMGTWFAAVSTFLAVIVSLWLAFKQINQDKEKLKCLLNMVIISGKVLDARIGLSIVSTGNRPANIQSISWIGENAKVAMLVVFF